MRSYSRKLSALLFFSMAVGPSLAQPANDPSQQAGRGPQELLSVTGFALDGGAADPAGAHAFGLAVVAAPTGAGPGDAQGPSLAGRALIGSTQYALTEIRLEPADRPEAGGSAGTPRSEGVRFTAHLRALPEQGMQGQPGMKGQPGTPGQPGGSPEPGAADAVATPASPPSSQDREPAGEISATLRPVEGRALFAGTITRQSSTVHVLAWVQHLAQPGGAPSGDPGAGTGQEPGQSPGQNAGQQGEPFGGGQNPGQPGGPFGGGQNPGQPGGPFGGGQNPGQQGGPVHTGVPGAGRTTRARSF